MFGIVVASPIGICTDVDCRVELVANLSSVFLIRSSHKHHFRLGNRAIIC
jgi:hypothetical protein